MDDRAFFDESFRALTGNPPFPWQARLFREFISGRLPSAVDLPTGLGKTSVMAIWYLALKAGAPVPRRLVYVVDRRVVVDQATTIADAIKRKSGDASLRLSTLRGRHLDNQEWLANPTAPAIIVGTVDMIGSRLLFSGYGVSPKMRPYHAGLLGADTLAVLDEAHLVLPFEALLNTIARDDANQYGPRSPEDRKIVPCLRLMSLSATGRQEVALDREGETMEKAEGDAVFHLDADDEHHPTVLQRLGATKELAIRDTFDGKTSLVDELAQRACALGISKPARVLVYCHGRGDAEKVKTAVDKYLKKDGVPSELLVGQRRVHEREQLFDWLKRHGFIEGPTEASTTAFLIATAAGEVGVDLDADHIVCDLVEWERMVQRLGRVNRRGGKQSQIEVIALPSKEDKKETEPWADRVKRLRAPFDLLPALAGGGRDASPAAILRLKANPVNADVLRCAQTPEPLRPALNRALVDAWSMTSLQEHTGRPDIQPWLRGWDKDQEPQTTIVWRSHLPVRIQNGRTMPTPPKEINEFFDAAPPHLSEILETETRRVAEWLFKRVKVAQAEAEKRQKANEADPFGKDRVVLLILNVKDELEKDGERMLGQLAELGSKNKERERKAFIDSLIGRTLVVAADLGGLEKNGMLSDDEDEAPSVMDADDAWEHRPFRVRVANDAKLTAEPGWKPAHRFATERNQDGEEISWLIVEERQGQSENEDTRAVSRRPQLLKDHRKAVEAIVQDFGRALHLPLDYVEVLGLGARCHDEGKDFWRWRLAFGVPLRGEAYAKTTKFIRRLLDGYRHEFGSLLKLKDNPDSQKLSPDLRDLLLHLVAAHHGNARPLISAKNCEGAAADLGACALEVTLRFQRLQKRWGPWGLAWWESLLRAADQMASRQNDELGEAKSGKAEAVETA